jgi:hypothetical protein
MAKGRLRTRTRALREKLRRLPQRRPLSHVLLHFARYSALPTNFAALRDAIGDRGIAAFLFFFGAFNCLPLPPGTSLVSGIPCLMLSWQLMRQRKAAWLPQRVLDLPVTESTLGVVRLKLIPRLFWLEKFIKPRYWPMLPGQDEAVIGLICAFFSIILILPIPLGNWLPAYAIAALALALLQRDGVMLLIGGLLSVASLVVLAFVGAGFMYAFKLLLQGDLSVLWEPVRAWFQ